MKKTLALLLIFTLLSSSTFVFASNTDDSWQNIQYDPELIQTWEHGQVISTDPYKIVDFRGGKDFEVFYILTYQGWERTAGDSLAVHWISEEVDTKTGKLLSPPFPHTANIADYFLEYSNSTKEVNSIIDMPPMYDRPPTDPQAKREGKPKAIEWLYDAKFHWGYSYIRNLFNQNIINGFPDGSFKPNNEVTYEQFIKMLVLTKGISVDTNSSINGYSNFSNWSKPYVDEALKNGIFVTEDIEGVKGSQPISREVAVYMLMNAYGSDVNVTGINFKDKDSIKYLKEVEQAVSLGIINGFKDNTFRPQNTLTRAEASKILVLLQEKL